MFYVECLQVQIRMCRKSLQCTGICSRKSKFILSYSNIYVDRPRKEFITLITAWSTQYKKFQLELNTQLRVQHSLQIIYLNMFYMEIKSLFLLRIVTEHVTGIFKTILPVEIKTQLESYFVLTDRNQSYNVCSKCDVAGNSLQWKLKYCRRCTFRFKLCVPAFHV